MGKDVNKFDRIKNAMEILESEIDALHRSKVFFTGMEKVLVTDAVENLKRAYGFLEMIFDK